MTVKELIEALSSMPQDLEVMTECGGNALYIPAGVPYLRNLCVSGIHSDYICIGPDIKIC